MCCKITKIFNRLHTMALIFPPADFDPNVYLQLNPDVAKSGMNPAVHFIRYGQYENRVYNQAQANKRLSQGLPASTYIPPGQQQQSVQNNQSKAPASKTPEQIASEQRAAQEAARQTALNKQQADFQGRLQSAVSGATNEARSAAERAGLDYSKFEQDILRELDKQKGNIPDLAQNPATLFNPQSIIDTLVNRELQRIRGNASTAIDAFAPTQFDVSVLPNTLDDNYIEQLINEQYNPAAATLERARARGTLNDQGYNTALTDLGNQRKAATARLQDTGNTLIDKAREDIRGIADSARRAGETLGLKTSFDPTTFQNQINNRVGEFTSGFEGKLRNAIGGEQFFNTGATIQRGGQAQGATNPGGGTTLLDVLAERQNKSAADRGVGNRGVF